MSVFYIEAPGWKPVEWSDLLADLSGKNTYNPYIKSARYYDIFRDIVYSMLCGYEITLLDSDFSDNEIEGLTGIKNAPQITAPGKVVSIGSFDELVVALNNTPPSWGVTIFTSGTTGKPKKITHSFLSITRFVRHAPKHRDATWGFAYNPTHMAGLQVFFQALLNGCPMVRLFGLSRADIFRQIVDYGITHISATPTFYRLLLPADTRCPSVQRLTSGGERFDDKATAQMATIFPNAKINNVYASTELGTLFASKSDIFTINPENIHLIRIENGELYVHRSMMGKSAGQSEDPWYNTGDMVEIVEPEPLSFRIVARTSSMINVGGYKVNPTEVEDVLKDCPGIVNARVTGKANALLGHIIIAEVVKSDDTLNELRIRHFLRDLLQEYKIPRIIKFVDHLSVTRTGKIQR